MCPNDNAAMEVIARDGVQFDMCPTCRGVWLDRGELEKLLADARAEADVAPVARQPPPERYDSRRGGHGDHDRGRDSHGGGHGGGYGKHGRRRSIFDVFD
ncbi:conserved hypothetical protein (plasmid) [Phenylobacterium zucineum HLK1]|uniref:Transcription factor zinc-finger domain-containing protein n=2 Tax=Phenylobacterium TaxID=20 RepID=B4RIN7_PHEZH|nr:conserved hypothetical protein [Phenylobacterium zucineum HLK1]